MRAFPRPAMLLAAGALALLAGCSNGDQTPHQTSVEQPTASDPTSPGTAASDPASPVPSSDPGAGTSPSAGVAPTTLADRLLATSEVPGLNASWQWQDGETGPAGADPFGTCAKVDLASIGATDVINRSYFPPVDTDDHAGEQIADFPDAATAARAAKVLASWHDQCRSRITAGSTGIKVGPVQGVSTSTGKGTWYLVSWTPKGAEEGRYHAFGTVVDGTRIAVLSIDNGGQDHNYPPGGEPMQAMVAAAAKKLV